MPEDTPHPAAAPTSSGKEAAALPHRSATISVLVDNESGVLARVIGLFAGRGYNIDSLTVASVDAGGELHLWSAAHPFSTHDHAGSDFLAGEHAVSHSMDHFVHWSPHYRALCEACPW